MRHVQINIDFSFFEGFLSQADIARVVLNQKDVGYFA
jgi:hypothetical protein